MKIYIETAEILYLIQFIQLQAGEWAWNRYIFDLSVLKGHISEFIKENFYKFSRHIIIHQHSRCYVASLSFIEDCHCCMASIMEGIILFFPNQSIRAWLCLQKKVTVRKTLTTKEVMGFIQGDKAANNGWSDWWWVVNCLPLLLLDTILNIIIAHLMELCSDTQRQS